MNKHELAAYWLSSAEIDETAFYHLIESKDNHWALFMGHIVIEKLLKALIAQNNMEGTAIPRSHDLLLLAKKAQLEVNEHQEDLLDLISTFNLNARYPDYKQAFYKKCTNEYTNARVSEIKEVTAWLKGLIHLQQAQSHNSTPTQ